MLGILLHKRGRLLSALVFLSAVIIWVFSWYSNIMGVAPSVAIRTACATTLMTATAAVAIDTNWHPPKSTAVNNLDTVLNSTGVYGFIFNSSETPAKLYGRYNWCNMPHVRKEEYIQAPKEYELAYVEVVGLHFILSDSHILIRDPRSIVTTRELHISLTRSRWNRTPGVATMQVCSIMGIRTPDMMQRSLTGRSTRLR